MGLELRPPASKSPLPVAGLSLCLSPALQVCLCEHQLAIACLGPHVTREQLTHGGQARAGCVLASVGHKW